MTTHDSQIEASSPGTGSDHRATESAIVLYRAIRDLSALERQRALDAACQDQPLLRASVEQLLTGSAADQGDGNMEFDEPRLTQAYGGSSTSQPVVGFGPGSTVGRYKLLEEIGEGGFGTVFLAQQFEPVRRKVALKIIKLGMDTRQVIARFEAERQALAMMDHPHIARVLDAGATESGRPYFVMELVRGEPITDFCDRRKLHPRQRLELFQQICLAVQHAHQKGIIHRDIKPSNVLVTLADDQPHAKVIDFGIAKATNSELTEKTLYTEFQQLIGTPIYMSPEQIERGGMDVDTRTDIYSMGVLLYELLTGLTPFEQQRIKSSSWNELQRMICDEEPPTMSARISGLQAESVAVAKSRSLEPVRLKSLLRGDLDWIVMKAIDKSRTRRYGTASELHDDIGRYLRDDPVLASPPTPGYRIHKLLRRHRVAVMIGTSLFLGLLAALFVTTSFMFWAMRERERAQVATNKAQEQARRAERFSNLAGNPFLDAEDVAKSNEIWGAEIQSLARTLPADSPKRIRKECQYATWLVTQAQFNNRPQLLRNSVVDIADLHERAKRVLGLKSNHFLSLANARVQAAIMTKEKPEEIRHLVEDVVAAYQENRGQMGGAYTDLLMERALTTMLSGAGNAGPTAEALSVIVDTLAKTGIPGEQRAALQARMKNFMESASAWAEKPPTWTESLGSWNAPTPPQEPVPEDE